VPSTTKRRPSLADFEVATTAVPPVDDRLVHRLPVAAIRLSGRNPRANLPALDELVDSIREHGLLQPIVVRRVGSEYELIAGHRRLEASKTLGETEIAAVVRTDVDAQQAYILTLVENLQREDLEPSEEAVALQVLIDERGWTTRQVGAAIKRSHMYVSRRLRVFKDPVLTPLVMGQQLSVGAAEELLRVSDAGERQQLAQRATVERWERPRVRAELLQRRSNTPRLEHGVPAVALSSELVRATGQVLDLLDQGPVSDLSTTARADLRRLYQRLALLVAD
jgi:ParB family transcriptional regulator, chromosome partitioning protein